VTGAARPALAYHPLVGRRAPKPRIGISACLLGQGVRWDGQHRRDPYLVDVLGEHVEWVPVCPEVEVGMGVPREPIRLVGDPRAPRLLGEGTVRDHTAAMKRFAEARVRALAALELAGYVTKRDSPSCGLAGVPVHPARGGAPRRVGVGAFARVLVERLPLLPVEDEARLQDLEVRDAFVERVFAHARWRAAAARGMGRAELVSFHAAHAAALAAHDPRGCRRLGALAAAPTRGPFARVVEAYGRGFMEALRVPASRARHAQVLARLAARLRPALTARERAELAGALRDYACGRAPLLVPLTLLRHHARRHALPGLAGQTYLEPDPRELALRIPG
jgi:uncharacterized protein YbbK (DUF523 family)/uncharacterized protein YbgA (DUF1722 family)